MLYKTSTLWMIFEPVKVQIFNEISFLIKVFHANGVKAFDLLFLENIEKFNFRYGITCSTAFWPQVKLHGKKYGNCNPSLQNHLTKTNRFRSSVSLHTNLPPLHQHLANICRFQRPVPISLSLGVNYTPQSLTYVLVPTYIRKSWVCARKCQASWKTKGNVIANQFAHSQRVLLVSPLELSSCCFRCCCDQDLLDVEIAELPKGCTGTTSFPHHMCHMQIMAPFPLHCQHWD